jgi:hypothetical protein
MISVSQVQGGSANIAVNLAYVFNPNLDCQDFPLPPLPTGLCFSVNYTVYAGFSWSDVLRGFLHMLADMALTWAVGAVAAVLSGAIQGLLSSLGKGGVMRAMGQAIASNFSIASDAGVKSAAGLMADGAGYFASNGRVFVEGWKFMPQALSNWFKSAPANQVVGLAASLGSTFGPGTPIGYAPINAPVGGAAPTSISSKLSTAIDNLFQ